MWSGRRRWKSRVTGCPAFELGEDRGELVRGAVDDRVPGDQAAEGGVGEVEGRDGADLEAEGGVGAAGDVDHARGEVDAERREAEAEAMEVGGDAAGAAAEVGDGPVPACAYEVGEGREHGAVQRLGGQFGVGPVGVVGGDGVVEGAGVVEEARLRLRSRSGFRFWLGHEGAPYLHAYGERSVGAGGPPGGRDGPRGGGSAGRGPGA
jgi:hypothetical protein